MLTGISMLMPHRASSMAATLSEAVFVNPKILLTIFIKHLKPFKRKRSLCFHQFLNILAVPRSVLLRIT